MNAILKYARDLPIVRMVEKLRNLLQRWFSNSQQQALLKKTKLTTWADMELRLMFNKSSAYEVNCDAPNPGGPLTTRQPAETLVNVG